MNPKMTVALSDLKYIQSEIQKILNLQKENTDEKKGGYYSINQRLMKQTFSSGLKKGQQNSSSGKRVNLIPPIPGSPNKSDRSLKSIGSDRKANNQLKSSKKRGVREDRETQVNEYSVASAKGQNQKKVSTQSATKEQTQKFNLKLSKVQHQKENDNEKQYPAGVNNSPKLSLPQQSQSAKDLIKKWMQLDRNSIKNDHKPSSAVETLKQKPKQIGAGVGHLEPSPKGTKKKRNSQSISSISARSTGKIGKANKQKQQQNQAYLYHSPRQQKLPYHLDSNNKRPLRTDQNYLTNKYNYKTLTKKEARQETLKQKYYVLDLQLNRIRQKMHHQAQISKQYVNTKGRLDEKSEKALKKYLRYSPLSKLIRANQKYRIEHQRSLSQNPRRTREQLKAIKVMQSGRPLQYYWNN